MTSGFFTAIELAQLIVSAAGAGIALSEYREVGMLRRVSRTRAEHVIASHAMRIEITRSMVHLLIIGIAGVALWMPNPPGTHPDWINAALFWRKLAVLAVALLASVGSWSAAVTRHRLTVLLTAPTEEGTIP